MPIRKRIVMKQSAAHRNKISASMKRHNANKMRDKIRGVAKKVVSRG